MRQPGANGGNHERLDLRTGTPPATSLQLAVLDEEVSVLVELLEQLVDSFTSRRDSGEDGWTPLGRHLTDVASNREHGAQLTRRDVSAVTVGLVDAVDGQRRRTGDPVTLRQHADDLRMRMLADLADQRAAIRLRHPVVRLDPLLGVDTRLKPPARFAGVGRVGGGVERLTVHGTNMAHPGSV